MPRALVLHLQFTHLNRAKKKELTQILSTAYWIAFGPHGPRAADPPGTNARIAWGVAVGVGASIAIFAAIRMVAKPAPYTMTKEYQEESNEFLLVRHRADERAVSTKYVRMLTSLAETKRQPRHRYLFRRLHWQGCCPVSSQGQLNHLIKYARRTLSFPFVIEERVDRGKRRNISHV